MKTCEKTYPLYMMYNKINRTKTHTKQVLAEYECEGNIQKFCRHLRACTLALKVSFKFYPFVSVVYI